MILALNWKIKAIAMVACLQAVIFVFGRHVGQVEVGRSGRRGKKAACPKTHEVKSLHQRTGFLIGQVGSKEERGIL